MIPFSRQNVLNAVVVDDEAVDGPATADMM